MDTMINDRNTKENELHNIRTNNDQDVSNKLQLKKQLDQLARLESDKISNEQQAKGKEESLMDNIKEAENNNKIKKKELQDVHTEIYE
jgi:cilia- and flagella-associated protein 57